MTDVVVDRLRLRGTDARRLATVAARLLPDALDSALAELDDVSLGSVRVELRLDPADYDDATLAVLWADRIRSAVLSAGASIRPRAPTNGAGQVPGVVPGAAPRTGPAHAARAESAVTNAVPTPASTNQQEGATPANGTLAAVILSWLDAGAPTTAVPTVLATLADVTLAAAVAEKLGPSRAERLAGALGDVAHAATRSRPTPPAEARRRGSRQVRSARDADADALSTVRAPQDTAVGASTPARTEVSSPADDGTPAARLARFAAGSRPLLDLAVASGAPSVDLATGTQVAGLVLLHPWLADLCTEAESWCSRAEPTLVRRTVLTSLVDPGEPALMDDPLVLLLAGAAPDAAPSSALEPVDRREELALLGEVVLTRFAALLPGFERSSATFVRDSWLARAGLVDTDRDPVLLLAETAPLDVMLSFLPYPVGLLRLPWTPPLAVRFVP